MRFVVHPINSGRYCSLHPKETTQRVRPCPRPYPKPSRLRSTTTAFGDIPPSTAALDSGRSTLIGTIAFTMTDDAAPPRRATGATSCGSPSSSRSSRTVLSHRASRGSSTSTRSGASVAATGPVAPLTYVVVSAVLGADLRAGPDPRRGQRRAVRSGARHLRDAGCDGRAPRPSRASLGRRAGRDSARALLGHERADRIDAQIDRGGLWAVVGQRFIPGISDALASYAFGAFGVPLWQMARRRVHRIGAAGVRLHRARCLDRRPLCAAGIHRDRGVVRDRRHRCLRRAPRLPKLAWTCAQSRRRDTAG